ncbi:MAG TPA: PIN domain-containing protein [Bacteroidota bacterium]|nr:PIN domain-containing protein [Bacteroidota bacterium]
MEKVTVFLDSNVLFSVAWTGREKSRSAILFELQSLGFIRLFISRLVLEETKSNLREKRPEDIPFFEELSGDVEVVPDLAVEGEDRRVKELPENDRVILSTAVAHGMDFFLTGNTRDFRDLYRRRIGRTLILTPREFLNRQLP